MERGSYFGYLGALSYPAGIAGIAQTTRGNFSIYHLNDLFNHHLAERACYPFACFFEERLAGDETLRAADCVGISVPYDHQLMHALFFARALKRQWPGKLVVLGGTSVSQVYKYMRDASGMKLFFADCDALVVGEGETAMCEIASMGLRHGTTNTITYNAAEDRLHFPSRIHYEDVQRLGTPVYDCAWDLYLSPSRGVNYSPTRACYWNRCTFCDYGLNSDKPTSPWRERPIPLVIADLTAAVKAGAEFVYFAVDVMAPAYLERLSDAIVESDLQFSWSAELRLEKTFNPERCKRIADAGCVCVSFGMESGSQRVLNLLDKGTSIAHMSATMKSFAAAGIAVQLMAFTGFPGEAAADRTQTSSFIRNANEYWSTLDMGRFALTGAAMVAKDPGAFGIELIPRSGADIARVLDYRFVAGNDEEQPSDPADGSVGEAATTAVLRRPWAGGTDTLHSMIYYRRYGRRFFRDNQLYRGPLPSTHATENLLDCTVKLAGILKPSVFDIPAVLSNIAAHNELKRTAKDQHQELTFTDFLRRGENVPDVERNAEDRPKYWLCTDARCIALGASLYEFLLNLADSGQTVREGIATYDAQTRERLVAALRNLLTLLAIYTLPSGEEHVPVTPLPGACHAHAAALRNT